MVCYAGKQEKPFWFSSLGQIVQFGAIILCRTFGRNILASSGGLKKTLAKSHDYSRFFPKEKRRLKTLTESRVKTDKWYTTLKSTNLMVMFFVRISFNQRKVFCVIPFCAGKYLKVERVVY